VRNIVFIPIGAVATALIVTGCNSIATIRDTRHTNSAFQENATKAEVIAQMGQPASKIAILDGRGECFNYIRVVEGKSRPFYVGFNQDNIVTNAGYDRDCAQAVAEGRLAYRYPGMTNEPPKKR